MEETENSPCDRIHPLVGVCCCIKRKFGCIWEDSNGTLHVTTFLEAEYYGIFSEKEKPERQCPDRLNTLGYETVTGN